MQEPALATFLKRMKEDIINRHDAAAAVRYYAVDFRTRNAIPGRAPGLAGLTTALQEFLEAFPDAHETVEEVVASADHVAAVGTIRGTHRGTFAGIPATGRRVTLQVFELHRVEAGKIQSGWVFLDMMGLVAQLGPRASP